MATVGLGVASAMARASADVALPAPRRPGNAASLNAVLEGRRSIRRYADRALTLPMLSDLLWAAQGITGAGGRRTAPSAGALYPIRLHVVAERVDGLPRGAWRYEPGTHGLQPSIARSVAGALVRAGGNQQALALAPLVIAITAVHAVSEARYGDRARRYVAFEAGAVAENIALQAVALGLGTVVIGAFDDDAAARALQLPATERVLALLPVGVRE